MQIQTAITSGEIFVEGRLIDASNATLVGKIKFDSLEKQIPIIYKPIAGERPLWDFSSGNLASREVATYLTSQLLGICRVPFTVLRDGPFGIGMVQQWIEVDEGVDLIAFSQSNDMQLREIAFLDAIVNNTDRKIGHLLLDKNGFLFGCDHGVTFHIENKLRTVLWQWRGEMFNELERSKLQLLTTLNLEKEFKELLSSEEVLALRARVSALIESNRFPYPSDQWPAIPWPPV